MDLTRIKVLKKKILGKKGNSQWKQLTNALRGMPLPITEKEYKELNDLFDFNYDILEIECRGRTGYYTIGSSPYGKGRNRIYKDCVIWEVNLDKITFKEN